MINIIKSIITLVMLVGLIAITIYLLILTIKRYQSIKASFMRLIGLVAVGFVTVVAITLLGDYVYPFERKTNPILIAEIEVSDEYALKFPGECFWHGAYEAYGLYAESFYFDPTERDSHKGFSWPPMDFENHSYVITYGQRIDSLSYNVWETIDVPIRTGAKVGHMDLEDDFYPNMIYVYQLPKMRIDKDINGTTNGGRLSD